MNIEKSPYTFKGSYRGRNPNGIVLHAASEYIRVKGKLMRIDEFFSKFTPYEYHYTVLPDTNIIQMISEDKTAAHAGTAIHNGRTNLNTNYLGVCFALEGESTYEDFLYKIKNTDWVKPEQFNTGLELVKSLMQKYNIDKNNIVRHSDVSGDDVRGEGKGKQDPGHGFDYVRFIGSL